MKCIRCDPVSLLLSIEAVSVDLVRANIEQVQTEWDVCVRELEAARERVRTQTRLRAVSKELADLDRVLREQDRWLDSTSAVEKMELRNLSGECQVGFRDTRMSFCVTLILNVTC